GAGCGKTFVLTERFISHLDGAGTHGDAARLNQLIAITFTDAAAREMRSRIRAACYERLHQAESPDSQQQWLRHLREIDTARISTIHAFCASLLRTHAAQAGLDPTFGVLDQSDADVLQYEVIDDVLRRQLEDLDAESLDLAAAYGLQVLKQQVAELLCHRHETAFQEWSTKAPRDLVEVWSEWHNTHAIPHAVAEIAAEAPIETLVRLLKNNDVSAKNARFNAARTTLLELVPRLHTLDDALNESHLNQIHDAARVANVCTTKDWPSKENYAEYRDACAKLRGLIEKHQLHPFDENAALETARLGLALLTLTAKVAEAYDDRKRTQGKLDFDDLLAKADALLTSPENIELRDRLADDLCLLLVDEFQDTDQLQANLVTSVCGKHFDTGRLFFVGDFKQSIYRFRGAQPKVFSDLRDRVQEDGRLPLTLNFRSQPEILHFVNSLFCDTFNQEGNPYEHLRPQRKQRTDPPCVEFLWTITPDKNKRSETGNASRAREQESLAIARRVRSLIDNTNNELPIIDKETGQPRALKPGDVAILFRTLSDVQAYEEALRRYGLDYYLVGGYAFYAQQEIFDVLNLLRAVSSTADEVSLAGALRSPFFALADETLFWLANSSSSLNAGLLAESPPSQLSTEERAKVAAAGATIRHLRSIKDRVSITELLNAALDRTGYDAVLLGEFLGDRKLANLNKLLERARLADQSGAIDLDGFITQLSQFVSREPKESLAATLPEAADVIRLMTIHHAKGLEFPLVIVADLDRPPLLRPPCAALHPVLGPLVPSPDNDDGEKTTTGMSLFTALERRDELDERKRMLYVACTRAADYLILSSSLEAFDKPKSDWMKLLAERFNLENGRLLATLPDKFEIPQIRVTTDPQTDQKPASLPRGPDLVKLVDEAQQIAANGEAPLPPQIAVIPVDRTAQHQFSFSRLTGQLINPHALSPWEWAGVRAPFSPPPSNVTSASLGATAGLPSSAPIDPRTLGTLVHDVLSRIDFAHPTDIAAWCEHLAPLHVLHNADRACQTALDMVERFIASPRGQQLAAATQVHREVDFLLAWPPGKPNPDGRYIQGVIDCLVQDATGAWRIIDFKTNDITPADVPSIAERYELQLQVYAIAAERTLGQEPSELVLHFLRPGTEHIVTWNNTTRDRTIQTMTKLIRQTTNALDQ
ncbi:MAG TPA: UvrD-helicase domain-containing protein, partial [Lacipirellulaceae bacterium]|nr:UvrD-helicase domain-containing protein [Lacipirellulaceae bacterium]